MKRKIFTLIMCAVTFAMVSAQTKTMTIHVASKPVLDDAIIDGNDPWVDADWVVPAEGKTSNVGDMSAKFQLRYDKDNLYFGAVVTDGDRFTGNATTYNNDCIEFFISMDTTAWASAGAYHPDLSTKQMRLQAVADPAATGGAIECGQTAPPNGKYVCVDNGSNYVQEWTMAWAELSDAMDPAWDQKQFRFDLQIANATGDGLRTQQMFWNDASDLQWNNTTHFGIVELATAIPDLGGSVNEAANLTINPCTKPALADGIIDSNDPWVASAWVDVANGKTSNVGDMTAKFQLTYDKTNIYFGAVVMDGDRFTGNATTYNNDCIEFFISMDTTAWATAGAYHPDLSTKQLRLQAVADPAATGGAIECGQTAPASGQYVCVDNGSNYVQEWIMPWAELSADMDPAWTQDQFRFDLQIANATADGVRSQQMFWHDNSDLQWNNTTHFGIVALKTSIPNLPSAVKDVKASKSAIYVSNDVLRGVKGMVSVYDITGKLVLKSQATNGTISIASLKQGIYIVNSDNTAAKISIR